MQITKVHVTEKLNIAHVREFAHHGMIQQLKCCFGSVMTPRVFVDPIDQLQLLHAGGKSTTQMGRRVDARAVKRMLHMDGRMETLSARETERLFKKLEST